VKIYSEPGEGTTVKIYLPRLLRSVDEQDDDSIPIVGSDEGETILVVEDDTDLRSYLAEVLRELGYRSLLARTRNQQKSSSPRQSARSA
jgi:hypothetical protein